MRKFMLFLGRKLLYLLYIYHSASALSVPDVQGSRKFISDAGGTSPPASATKVARLTSKDISKGSYKALFEDFPTLDTINRFEENQNVNAHNDIAVDSILQNNRTDNDSFNTLTYGFQSPIKTPLPTSIHNGNNDLGELDKVELHTNNHQSLNSHISRHYNHYLMASLSANGANPTNYGGNNKYGPSNSNSLANNLNLNYIHNLLLTKPSSSMNSLSNLLNFNSNSLSITTSPHGLSMQNGYVSSYYSAPSSAPTSSSSTSSIQQPSPMKAIAPPSSTPPAVVVTHEPSLSSNEVSGSGTASLCGKQQINTREPRIVGGNSTFEGEFPWAVSIQRQGNHHCGGVIVGKRWILTAAHCVRSQLIGNLIVRTGGHTLARSMNNINSHLRRDYMVEQIVMHDDFSRLKSDIHWNEFAWPVCFPKRESGNFSGHDATVIGWGKLSEKSEDFSNELQKVKLTIIDNKVCQNWFRQAGRDMPIDDRIICAGFKNGGKDACHGDSGGPLLSKINGHYTVVGVVSTGIGCARPLLPGLYSRVSSYIGWIERYVI